MSAPEVPAPQIAVRLAAPPQAPPASTPQAAPIFVSVADPKVAKVSSGWAATAVVLLGALVAVIVISRILSLSQRVFELESRPAVEDAQLKGLIKTQIDETVREMEAAARSQHQARVQRMQEMQAQQKAAESKQAAAEELDESQNDAENGVNDSEQQTERQSEQQAEQNQAEDAETIQTNAGVEVRSVPDMGQAAAPADSASMPASASKSRGSKRKTTLAV